MGTRYLAFFYCFFVFFAAINAHALGCWDRGVMGFDKLGWSNRYLRTNEEEKGDGRDWGVDRIEAV